MFELFSPRCHSCQMLFQTKNSLSIHMERFHKKTSYTIIVHIGRYFSSLQCALSSCDFPCLDLETKVLSHSARVWIWFEWCNCLCLVSLSLEVNLSSHWSHSRLLTLLWAVALCSRAWGRLLTAWPQILHCKLNAACPSAESGALLSWLWWWWWSRTSHISNCTEKCSDCEGCGNRITMGRAF